MMKNVSSISKRKSIKWDWEQFIATLLIEHKFTDMTITDCENYIKITCKSKNCTLCCEGIPVATPGIYPTINVLLASTELLNKCYQLINQINEFKKIVIEKDKTIEDLTTQIQELKEGKDKNININDIKTIEKILEYRL